MTPLTDAALAEALALAAAATPGPWFVVPLPWRRRDMPSYVTTKSTDPHAGTPVLDAPDVCGDEEEDWITQADHNLAFAAAAREGWPRAVQEVQALRKALDEVHRMLDALRRLTTRDDVWQFVHAYPFGQLHTAVRALLPEEGQA